MIFSYLLNMQSHPSWVCGLKHLMLVLMICLNVSHPSWVCGLKQITHFFASRLRMSHPSWVCGLKLDKTCQMICNGSHTLRGCVD